LTSIFVTLALDSAAGRCYWDTEDLNDRKKTLATWAWCQITVAFVFAGLIFTSSGWLAQVLVRRRDAEVYFCLAAMTLPLSVLGTVITNWLRMQRRPHTTMVYSLGISLFQILLTIMLVVVLRRGLLGIYIAQVTTATISTAIAVILLKDWIAPSRFQLWRLRMMLKYSFPLIPAALAYWVVNLSGRYFVQFFSSTSEVGLYEVANAAASVVALMTGAFQQAWGPFAMSVHRQAAAKDIYANVLPAYLWLTCLSSTALALFTPELLGLFTSEAYSGASHLVALLAFSYVMIGLGYIAAIGPTIVKTTRPYGLAVTVAAGLTICLNFLLIPRLGKEGAATATLIGQAVVPLYMFYRSQKLYPIPYRFGPVFGILALSWVVVCCAQNYHPGSPLLEISAKALLLSLFLPAAFVFRLLTPIQARYLLMAPHRVSDEGHKI
jgi:O-antigen/teichoic acid export membrane protein